MVKTTAVVQTTSRSLTSEVVLVGILMFKANFPFQVLATAVVISDHDCKTKHRSVQRRTRSVFWRMSPMLMLRLSYHQRPSLAVCRQLNIKGQGSFWSLAVAKSPLENIGVGILLKSVPHKWLCVMWICICILPLAPHRHADVRHSGICSQTSKFVNYHASAQEQFSCSVSCKCRECGLVSVIKPTSWQ